MPVRLLFVNDRKDESTCLLNELKHFNTQVILHCVENIADYQNAVNENEWDFVISNTFSNAYTIEDVVSISRKAANLPFNIIITDKEKAIPSNNNKHDNMRLIAKDDLNQVSTMINRDIQQKENNKNECYINLHEERMWEVLNNSLNEIYIFDALTINFTLANQAALKNLDYTVEEILALHPYDLIKNFSKNEFLKILQPLYNDEKKLLHFETSITRKNGSCYPVDIRIQASPDKTEKLFYAIVVDISERIQADEEINTLARFPEENPAPVIRLAPNTNVLYYNPASKHIVNFWAELFPSNGPEHWQQWIDDCLSQDGNFEFEETTENKVYSWQLSATPDKSYVYCYGRDITREKISEHDLLQAGQVFDHSIEGIMITDSRNRIIRVNPAFTVITGYTELESLGKDPSFLKSKKHDKEFFKKMWESLQIKGIWQGELWNKRKNGEIYPEFLTVNVIKNSINEISNYISIFADITERKEAQENIHRLAYYDSLTDLPNRFHIQEKLSLTIQKANKKSQTLTIVQVDVKRFKQINESLGHATADHLIELISTRLVEKLPSDVFIGRLAGDEFLIIEKNRPISNEFSPLIQTIQKALEVPFNIQNQEIYINVYMGVTHYPNDGETVETLLKHAETAIAYAKKEDKDLKIFSSDLEVRGIKHISMESSLRKALEREEFVLHYQPQFELATNKIIGAEALIRWQHPENGLIPPLDFIPLLEETGLIVPVGDWVIQKACSQIIEWNNQGIKAPRISINISAKQFNQRNLTKNIMKIISQTGVNPELLELEVTESTIMRNFDHVVKVLTELHDNNIMLSVDDFGTGYSSLSYLKHFPIDVLKIDRSFVKEIPGNTDDTAIVNTIISMGHNMNLKVIAEGVETQEQRNCLTTLGCEFAQGFYFSRPLSADDFLAYVNQRAEY